MTYSQMVSPPQNKALKLKPLTTAEGSIFLPIFVAHFNLHMTNLWKLMESNADRC